ncbi:NAD-dependent protein deacetylase sirtuin-1 [Chanos chanos]|uniref:protein acetyllysine N-acetyltransferase n=1 Tax=Chanos chanos TaxID=29144 RepID=A0A6J2VBC8_CHACN|nr:NAD-dependent protein deacetylase sirtuin-1 [Chanos chanos]
MAIQRGQIICGADTSQSQTSSIPTQPNDSETAMAMGQARSMAPSGDNNGILSSRPSNNENRTDSPQTSGPETLGLIDDGVQDRMCTTADFLNEDDDCSSHASSSDWTPQPRIGSYRFIQQHIMRETDPRTILKDLLPEMVLPPDLDDMTLWQIIINISEPPKRKKRKDINTLEDAVRLLNESKKILVLTGAGVSVSCGIPDFRSRDGIYARLAIDFPDLPDPQAMFDIEYFKRDPRPFFKFAKEIYPGQFQPSLCHKFISALDKEGKLLRNYTQNIDTLEQVAGVQRVIQCHGSFATASCLFCKYKVDSEALRDDIFNQVVPHCPRCPDVPLAIMKPDIVFFGENLPELFHRAMKQDKDEVDLLIVIGSSLKVRPVALIPSSIPHDVPQILINREPLPHLNFDIELLGDCDVIVNELCHWLGGDFEKLCYNSSKLSEITERPPRLSVTPEQRPSHINFTEVERHSSAKGEPVRSGTEIVNVVGLTDLCPNEEYLKTEETNLSSKAQFLIAEGMSTGQAACSFETKRDSCLRESFPEMVSKNPHESAGEEMQGLHVHSEDIKKDDDFAAKHGNDAVKLGRPCWRHQACKSPISKHLATSQYLFQAPNRYIFHGAEVYSSSEDETSSSYSSDSESSCCSVDRHEEEVDAVLDGEAVNQTEENSLGEPVLKKEFTSSSD